MKKSIFLLLGFILLHHALQGSEAISISSWAETTARSLSLDQKIGQLFMVTATTQKDSLSDFTRVKPYPTDPDHINFLLRNYHIGGVIFLGMGTPHEQYALTQQFQQQSSIPLLIGQDFEWGLSQRLHDTVHYPRNAVLGDINNKELIYKLGYEIGRQARYMGVHINFAPVIDVNNNPTNPIINTRSFGDNPVLVAECGRAFMQGLHDAGVLACAKHFPGHGDTSTDSHYTLPCVPHTLERLNSLELYPFKELIRAGVDAIMIAHLHVPALEADATTPTSLSPTTVTTLLKKTLHFNGLVITDGLDMGGVLMHHQPGEIELKALLAGNDILLCPVDVPKAHALIKQAVLDGIITEDILDEHVLKILRAKESLKLHTKHVYPPYDHAQLHTPHAYALQQEIAKRSCALP